MLFIKIEHPNDVLNFWSSVMKTGLN